MPNDKPRMKVEFAPGAFDGWEGTQEELDQFVAEIQRMAESGELEENSIDITDDEAWESLSEEEQDIIADALNNTGRRSLN
jgi:TRAP-type C4-dicarboxylate transport system substrate-binding protein